MISHENLLFIPSYVNAFINSYQKNLPNLESGGIILGKILPCKHILIEELTVPSAKDKRGFYFFERDKKSAQKIINTRWHESGGETIYRMCFGYSFCGTKVFTFGGVNLNTCQVKKIVFNQHFAFKAV